MKSIAAIVLGAAIAAAGNASAGGKSAHRENYAAFAGEPIPEFRFTQLHNWQRIGDRTVVLWTRPNTAYLLTLASACDDLNSGFVLKIGGVDGVNGRLRAGTGQISSGQLHCRVKEIRPIDLVALKAART